MRGNRSLESSDHIDGASGLFPPLSGMILLGKRIHDVRNNAGRQKVARVDTPYGEEAPIAGNDADHDWTLNRRAITLGAGGAALALLTGCSFTSDDDGPPEPTSTPEPSPT